MSLLHVSGISRTEGARDVLQEISFTQAPFQKLAIAGATGSGKTTLLKIIAGLLQPTCGTVTFDGERVVGPEEKLMAGHPAIAYLSQHFELLNNYRVADYLHMANKISDAEAALIYDVCRVDHLLKRWTHQLSGGEKQRIALARLLVAAPRLLLLDEPFSNHDVIHKNLLKAVIEAIGENLNITCILVSHDPADALSWADEIGVLQNGQLIQLGSPHEVYQNPVSEYAAALFGKYTRLNPALAHAFSQFADLELDQINRFFRPEQFRRVSSEKEGLKATVKRVRFLGSFYELETAVLGSTLTLLTSDASLKTGADIYIALQ